MALGFVAVCYRKRTVAKCTSAHAREFVGNDIELAVNNVAFAVVRYDRVAV